MQQAIQADFGVVSKDSFTYPDNGNHSVPREEFNITPREDSEVAEEEDNPFADTDLETGEILKAE